MRLSISGDVVVEETPKATETTFAPEKKNNAMVPKNQ